MLPLLELIEFGYCDSIMHENTAAAATLARQGGVSLYCHHARDRASPFRARRTALKI